jgi:hypothetical protein
MCVRVRGFYGCMLYDMERGSDSMRWGRWNEVNFRVRHTHASSVNITERAGGDSLKSGRSLRLCYLQERAHRRVLFSFSGDSVCCVKNAFHDDTVLINSDRWT